MFKSNFDKIGIDKFANHYLFLKIYTFFWWASLSMIFVFQNLFFFQIGLELYQIFFNSAVSVIISLFIVNLWSKISDMYQHKKLFITLGNLSKIISYFYLPFVNSFETMLIFTIINQIGPNSDAILISHIYSLNNSFISNNSNEENTSRPIYHKIRTYTEVRKFGSLGWALMLPFSGYFINEFGFSFNFIFSACLLLVLTIIFQVLFTESHNLKNSKSELNHNNLDKPSMNESNSLINSKEQKTVNAKVGISIIKNYKTGIISIFKNKTYKMFILISFIAAISQAINTTIFSIFNSNFTSDYILIGLTWSFNALLEYPIMKWTTILVERRGWENVVAISFLLYFFRLLFNPLLLFFNGNIIWVYLLQIINSFVFALGWPATTLGLEQNVEKSNKSLGFSFYNSIKLLGSFFGNIVGQIFSLLIADSNTFYVVLFIFASILSLIPAIVLFKMQNKDYTS